MSGNAWVGAPAIRETGLAIAARQRSASRPRTHVAPRHVLRATSTKLDAGTSGGASPNGQTLSPVLNFTAATFADCAGWPPDSMGAVGPAQFILAVNGRIRSFTKANGAADGGINANTDVFFNSVMTPGSNFTTDPRIRYDRTSGRWFIIMIDAPGRQGNQPNRLLVAMSDSGVISSSTSWSFFQFQQDLVGPTPNSDTGGFADYPTLGIDVQALYIGVNVFSSSGAFINTTAFVVQKTSLLNGGPIQVTAFRSLISGSVGPYTPQGVDNYDPAAAEGYFIGINVSGSGQLQLRRVLNPGSANVSLSGNISIAVAGWAAPLNVQALGTTGTNIDGLDDRLLAAHYRNGSLWTSQNVSVNGSGSTRRADRNGVRWYELRGIASGQTPTVAQSGTVYQSASAGSRSYWMGTVMVSGQGHAAIGCSTAGPTNYIDAAITGRLAGDAAGSMGAPANFTFSASAYNPADSSSPHRWGDYSYTSLDPADDMSIWTVQEWCQSSGNGYGLQVTKILAPPPALPSLCSPATVTQSVANVAVVLTGSTANGSGFFDPGPGFSNRLAMTINGGGVSVGSITYNDPATLTAVLNIEANAVPGPRTITVMNPDGQSSTSASAVLTVAAIATNHPPALAPVLDRSDYAGSTLLITNNASDPDNPPQLLTFSLGPGEATNASINPNTGVFSWTPTAAQAGTNLFEVIVTDNGSPPLSATQSFSVLVIQSNHAPTLAPITDRAIHGLMTLVVTNVATDPDAGQTLTFSLAPGAPTGATVGVTDGVLVWTPTEGQLGTNSITVRVVDNGTPALGDVKTFAVNVLARPTLDVTSSDQNGLTLAWNSIPGFSYQLQFSTNVEASSWFKLQDIVAAGSVSSASDTNRSIPAFYRLLLPK